MQIPDVVDGMRPCCKLVEFRQTVEQRTVQGSTGPAVATKTRCVVCGNNHYLLEVPPIPIGITGADL